MSNEGKYSDRVERILIEEIKRLEKLVDELSTDRDNFARRFYEAMTDVDYWRGECERMATLGLPFGGGNKQ